MFYNSNTMWEKFRRCLFLALTLVLSFNVLARENLQEVELFLDGQTNLVLEREFQKTIYKDEPYQDTCYRSEYYDENVCGNETKYKNVCNTVPGYEDCRTVNDRVCETRYEYKRVCEAIKIPPVCQNVTKYRRECNNEPPRQECRTIPGEVRCHKAPNGEQRCEKIPPRQECNTIPGRQVCRDVPYTQRECTQGRVEERCDYRNVPYQDCRNVPRRECRWIPARQECTNVAYDEYVCRIVTKEKKIPYTCTKYKQVGYQVKDELVIANVDIDLVKSQTNDLTMKALVFIDDQKKLQFQTKDIKANTLSVVTLETKSTTSTKEGLRTLNASYKINVQDFRGSSVLAGAKITGVSLQRRSMTFVINKEIDFSEVSSAITITKDGKTYLNKTLEASSVSVSRSSGRTIVTVNVIQNGGSELDGVFDKKFKVSLSLTQKMKLDSSVIFENVSNINEKVTYSATIKRD